MKKSSSLPEYITASFSSIQQQIPAVEREALTLIKTNCTNIRTIEYYLDTLYSLHISGFKVKAQHALITHLSGLDPKLAKWHKEEFEKEGIE
ncbi:MAG: hypothetical protein WDO71_10045 [Bacteroidota bacterium]